MKIAVHFSSGRVLDVLVLSFVIFAITPSKAYHENRQKNETLLKVNQEKKANELWTRLLVDNVKIPSHHKNVSGVHFATKPSVRKVENMASLHRSGRQKLTDFIWRRSALPFRGKKYWNGVSVTHPFYDTRLYKKQLTNTKDLEVDDEPYIVLPPDNTINTKEEAFKLDEGGATTAETTTPSTIPPTTTTTQTTQTTITTVTTPTTPLTTPTTLPPITTITTPPTTPTTPPTTPTPPPTTKPTEKVQVIAIHAGTPPTKRAFPTAANINLNLEIGDNGDASQPEQHESVPVTPTAQSIYTINQQEQSAEQPTPQVIIAPMPGGMGASQNQQPQIIMAQPAQTPPQQPQVVYAPQPPAQQQPQYVIAPQQPEQPQPEYVMQVPQAAQPPPPPQPIIIAAPTPPPAPVLYQQPVIQPVQQPAPISTSPMYLQQAPPPRAVIAAPQTPMYGQPNVAAPQVSISASPPASITVNSPGVQSPIGGLNNMLMPASYMGMPPANPFLMGSQMGMNGLQMPLFQNPQLSLSQGWPSPLGQLPQQFPSSPLLSSLPQGYDPLLYSGLIGMFANAIRSSMIQPQPNVLASALALAASQAQARNQPADLLTAALTQALAQNLQQGIQPISNAKLVQALSQALSQGQPAMRQNSNVPGYPPQPPPPNQQQPPPPPPPNQQQPPPPLPPRPGPTPYPQIKIPPYQVVPNTDQPQWPPYRDTRSDAANNNYSVNKVGKALASALIKAARKIASRNPSVTKTSHRDARYRHRNRERERSFVPLQHSRLNSKTMNPVKTQLTDMDMKTIFAMFRPFWKNIAKRCNLRGCFLLQRCSS